MLFGDYRPTTTERVNALHESRTQCRAAALLSLVEPLLKQRQGHQSFFDCQLVNNTEDPISRLINMLEKKE